MNIQEIIGIDVSKLVIDICIQTKQLVHQFENSNKGFKNMIKWITTNSSFSFEETLFLSTNNEKHN